MKKEKKRDLTIKQLEKKIDFISNIGGVAVIAFIIAVFAVWAYSNYYDYSIEQLSTEWIFMFLIFLVVLIFIIMLLTIKAQNKLSDEKKKINIATIKDYAQKGTLRQLVAIKSQEIINEVLAGNIEKNTVNEKNKDTLTVNIKLIDSNKTYPLTLSIYEFLDILDKDVKKEMFEDLAKDFKLDNQMLIIEGYENNLYVNNVSDDDLLKIFEFKD